VPVVGRGQRSRENAAKQARFPPHLGVGGPALPALRMPLATGCQRKRIEALAAELAKQRAENEIHIDLERHFRRESQQKAKEIQKLRELVHSLEG